MPRRNADMPNENASFGFSSEQHAIMTGGSLALILSLLITRSPILAAPITIAGAYLGWAAQQLINWVKQSPIGIAANVAFHPLSSITGIGSKLKSYVMPAKTAVNDAYQLTRSKVEDLKPSATNTVNVAKNWVVNQGASINSAYQNAKLNVINNLPTFSIPAMPSFSGTKNWLVSRYESTVSAASNLLTAPAKEEVEVPLLEQREITGDVVTLEDESLIGRLSNWWNKTVPQVEGVKGYVKSYFGANTETQTTPIETLPAATINEAYYADEVENNYNKGCNRGFKRVNSMIWSFKDKVVGTTSRPDMTENHISTSPSLH